MITIITTLSILSMSNFKSQVVYANELNTEEVIVSEQNNASSDKDTATQAANLESEENTINNPDESTADETSESTSNNDKTETKSTYKDTSDETHTNSKENAGSVADTDADSTVDQTSDNEQEDEEMSEVDEDTDDSQLESENDQEKDKEKLKHKGTKEKKLKEISEDIIETNCSFNIQVKEWQDDYVDIDGFRFPVEGMGGYHVVYSCSGGFESQITYNELFTANIFNGSLENILSSYSSDIKSTISNLKSDDNISSNNVITFYIKDGCLAEYKITH